MEPRTKESYLEKTKKMNKGDCIICNQPVYKSDLYEVVKSKRSIHLFHYDCYIKYYGRSYQ